VHVIETLHENITGDNSVQPERRAKRRFPIEQEVRYRMLYGRNIAETGMGRTMNMSSGGVWFTTETVLPVGMPVELSINWPVLLNDICPMKLMINGFVVHSDERGAGVATERYEFRTQGSGGLQQPGLAGITDFLPPPPEEATDKPRPARDLHI
jgi:hypothetical protein